MDRAKLEPTVIRKSRENVVSVSLLNASLSREYFIRDVYEPFINEM